MLNVLVAGILIIVAIITLLRGRFRFSSKKLIEGSRAKGLAITYLVMAGIILFVPVSSFLSRGLQVYYPVFLIVAIIIVTLLFSGKSNKNNFPQQ